MTSFVFRRTMQAVAQVYGNAYAKIERDTSGRPTGLFPLPAGKTKPVRVTGDERVIYKVTDWDNVTDEFHGDDILHISTMGFDGLRGRDELADARDAIGVALASEEFAGSFFANGATVGGVLSTEQAIDKDLARQYAEEFNALHQGAGKAQGVAVMGRGLEFKNTGTDPDKAQMVESRKFQVLEASRHTGVQPHLLFDLERATHSNIEQQSLEFLKYTLLGWVLNWEQELYAKLLTPVEQSSMFFRFLVDGLERGDLETRYASYALGRQWGWLSVNDIRRLENLNGIGPEGEVYLEPLNMQPVGSDNGAGVEAALTAALQTLGRARGANGAANTIGRIPNGELAERR